MSKNMKKVSLKWRIAAIVLAIFIVVELINILNPLNGTLIWGFHKLWVGVMAIVGVITILNRNFN